METFTAFLIFWLEFSYFSGSCQKNEYRIFCFVGSLEEFQLRFSFGSSTDLAEFFQVSLSSLNRHAVATRADVGMSKAVCLQNHFQRIFPECQVEARAQMFDASAEDELLSGSPDYVLDCIDNIDTKVLSLTQLRKICQHPSFLV